MKDFETLNATSTSLYNSMPESMKGAFFELVHHPVQATYTLAKMWIYAGINNMRAQQARLSTNDFGTLVEELFEQDYDIEYEYHHILDGM